MQFPAVNVAVAPPLRAKLDVASALLGGHERPPTANFFGFPLPRALKMQLKQADHFNWSFVWDHQAFQNDTYSAFLSVDAPKLAICRSVSAVRYG